MKLYQLIKGEVSRLIKYKILPVSILTSFLWVIIFLFISKEDARTFAPLLIFVDVGMMLMILLGASLHLEKQEGTIKSMMVMPVSLKDILVAKIVSSMTLGLESAVVVSLALLFIHGITINYGLLLLFIIITSLVHAAIGYLLSLISRDFTSMLVVLMGYIIVFALPTVLFAFGIISAKYEWFLLLSPAQSASNLITASIISGYDTTKLIFSSLYLPLLSIILIRYAVYPKFKSYALRG